MTEKIFITGAEGFIGSHLVEELVRQGRDVRSMALYNSFGVAGWLDTLPIRKDLDIVFGDVRALDSVISCMRGCSKVIHLAALIDVPYSYETPQSYIDNNVCGTTNMLRVAIGSDIEKFVQISSSEVYGTAQTDLMDESHPLSAQSPYAASKIAADQMALAFHKSYGLPVTIARPFNTYGPRQSSRAVLSSIITQALYGRPVKTGNLNARRDFNFVSDTVAGIIACLDADPTMNGQIFNIGSGVDYSIAEAIDIINTMLPTPMNLKHDASRVRPPESEVDRLCCDSLKANKMLGWFSKVNFEDGLRKTVDWFKKNAL